MSDTQIIPDAQPRPEAGYPQPPYPQPAYPNAPYPAPAARAASVDRRPWNVLALAAFAAAFLAPVVAVVFGHLSLRDLRHADERGRTLALVAVVLGYLFTALLIVGGIAVFVGRIVALHHGVAGSGGVLQGGTGSGGGRLFGGGNGGSGGGYGFPGDGSGSSDGSSN